MFLNGSLSSFPWLECQWQLCSSESDHQAFSSLSLTFRCLQGSDRTSCEIPLTPPSSCWFHFWTRQSPLAPVFLLSEGLELRILISHFPWDHTDTGDTFSLTQTRRGLARPHTNSQALSKAGRLTGAEQSSESTNLWNAVNIVNVLLLYNVTLTEMPTGICSKVSCTMVLWENGKS